jgi:hypothetical protein
VGSNHWGAHVAFPGDDRSRFVAFDRATQLPIERERTNSDKRSLIEVLTIRNALPVPNWTGGRRNLLLTRYFKATYGWYPKALAVGPASEFLSTFFAILPAMVMAGGRIPADSDLGRSPEATCQW